MGASSSRVWHRTAWLLGLLMISWCVMLVTHELGHIVGGWFSGATLKDYELRPWTLPYSIHDPDPHPLVTLWCGPILGVFAPLLAALLIRRRWSWFVADFCILANGAYLAASWFSRAEYLDTTQLLQKGAHPITLLCYCGVAIPIGYFRFRRDCMAVFAVETEPHSQKNPPAAT